MSAKKSVDTVDVANPHVAVNAALVHVARKEASRSFAPALTSEGRMNTAPAERVPTPWDASATFEDIRKLSSKARNLQLTIAADRLIKRGDSIAMYSNAQFAKADWFFRSCCEAAKVEPTARQASKCRRNMGAAFAARFRANDSPVGVEQI